MKISSHGTKCKMSNIYESELETICEKVVGLNQFDELIEKVTGDGSILCLRLHFSQIYHKRVQPSIGCTLI